MAACRLDPDERTQEFGISGDQRRRKEPFLNEAAFAVDVCDDLFKQIGALHHSCDEAAAG